MKEYIKKNKFFVCLLLLALLIILFLCVYIIQKDTALNPVKEPDNKEIIDTKKETKITALSANYTRGPKDNKITVAWAYEENNALVKTAYLYLNDSAGIPVTQNRYYDFTQNVFDYPTGDNQIRLELLLDNGQTITKEYTVFVKHIISTKQEVSVDTTTVNVTLEYVYDSERPVNSPEILMTSTPAKAPSVNFIDTQVTQSGNKTIARSTFSFIWNSVEDIPDKFSVRWKFNEIPDSFDYTVTKPQSKVN